ncbi:MAG: hypothetical protein FWD57_05810, partial [Polyangiaceae bacterium]|nr:hypothetical protein [Polyangiaceae bacterium]
MSEVRPKQTVGLDRFGVWRRLRNGPGLVCHVKGGQCELGCFILGTVYGESVKMSGNPCKMCDPMASGWSNSADKTACGIAGECNDGVCSEGCVIDGLGFVGVGEPNPDNPCEACRLTDQSDWTKVLEPGASCGVPGRVCNTSQVCVDGCTSEVGEFVQLGHARPSNACDICVADGAWSGLGEGASCGTAGQVCNASNSCDSGCSDDDKYVAVGDPRPSNPCWICQDDGDWSGQGEGAVCGAGQACDASNGCEPGCSDDDKYVGVGDTRPSNPCLICRADGGWNEKGEGAVCGTGQACDGSNGCEPGCSDGTKYVEVGDPRPSNPCLICRADGGWNEKGEGAVCGTGQACDASNSCEPGCSDGDNYVEVGDSRPSNPCWICRADGGWNAKGEGAVCGSGQACDASNSCEPGCSDGDNYVEVGDPRPSNPCWICRADGGWNEKGEGAVCGTGQACTASNGCEPGCSDGDNYVGVGDPRPSSPCWICRADGGFDEKGEGAVCGSGQACDASNSCEPGCSDGDNYVEVGDPRPSSPCWICQSDGGWTAKGEGAVCGTGQACTASNSCESGCSDGNKYVEVDDPRPSNPCWICQSGGGWSEKGEGASCGSGLVCDASNSCEIGCSDGNKYVEVDEPRPSSPCWVCQSGGIWVGKGAGASCGVPGKVCDASNGCEFGCSDDGAYVELGDKRPTNLCEECADGGEWSGLHATACTDGGNICDHGTCKPGCVIGAPGTHYPSGEDLSNPCRRCDIDTPTVWTPVGIGTSCS